jgi:hypothetical protein
MVWQVLLGGGGLSGMPLTSCSPIQHAQNSSNHHYELESTMVAEEYRKHSSTDPAMLITQCLRGLLKVAQLKKSTAKGRKVWAGDEAGKESKRFWDHRVVALIMVRQA